MCVVKSKFLLSSISFTTLSPRWKSKIDPCCKIQTLLSVPGYPYTLILPKALVWNYLPIFLINKLSIEFALETLHRPLYGYQKKNVGTVKWPTSSKEFRWFKQLTTSRTSPRGTYLCGGLGRCSPKCFIFSSCSWTSQTIITRELNVSMLVYGVKYARQFLPMWL